ncbi:putative phage portal protein [Nocardia nova SH22a]|uniref:Putative phage portal protein n=1 Tax=Nocardia nova SH22a TaxID=1415166 RepID=W5TXZ2_9NOCA|nr:phage portal protein [Nocardia nova]AHH22096.1 putative phage portal protein [Nocardia nova SH22a]
MSSEMIPRLKQLSDEENDTLAQLAAQLERKARRNVLRKCYYDGKYSLRRVSPVVPPQYYRLGLVLGWSAKAVDTLARRCNLDGFVWPDGDLGSLGVANILDDNNFESVSNSAITSSLIHACSFLVNTEGGEGEPRSLIHVKDALNATGEWNSRARRLDNLLSITGRGERDDSRSAVTAFALYLDDLTITAEFDSSGWTVDRQDHSWGVPAEVIAYKPLEPSRPFGASRISRAVMSLHSAALRTVIRMEGHADIYSYPELILLGADVDVFKNADGTQRDVWQVMMGRINGIPDDDEADNPRADVRQIPAASPQPHLDMLKQQAQLFSGETSIPLTSLGVSDMSNPTSADSYIASREDLISEAEGATDDMARGFRRSMIRALAIANDIGIDEVPTAWASLDTKWRSPVYLSRAAQADAGMKQLTAVPWLAETSVGLELVGLNEQQIRRAESERRRAGAAASVTQRLAAQLAERNAPPATPAADDQAPVEEPAAQ